jgi:hypothetical protein
MNECTLEKQGGKGSPTGSAQMESTSKLHTMPSKNLAEGAKYDEGKLRWGLLPWSSVEDVVRVLMYGAEKYEDNSWQRVENGQERYLDALTRHLVEIQKGHVTDSESGLSHMSHVACNALFLLYLMEQDQAYGEWILTNDR